MPNAFAYVVAQAGGEPSVAEQENRLRALFDRQYAARGFAWGGAFADDEVSARRPFGDRDAARRLIRASARGDMVLLARVPLAFRSLTEFVRRVEWLVGRLGVALHAEDLGRALVPGHPGTETALAMLSAYADLDRSIRAHQTRQGVARKGRTVQRGGKTPYGFVWAGRGKKRRLEANLVEREYGARVVECRERGMSWKAIARHFDKAAVLYRGKSLTTSGIRHLLARELRLREQAPSQWAANARAGIYPAVAAGAGSTNFVILNPDRPTRR
jgi:DNA invertase Pin-like site-specific DNA recombinase